MSSQIDLILVEVSELARTDLLSKVKMYDNRKNSGAMLWTRINKNRPLPSLYQYPSLPIALRMAYTACRDMLFIWEGIK